MGLVTPLDEQFLAQAVAFDSFAPAIAIVNQHAKRLGIGIIRHRQHSISEIAHRIRQIGVAARRQRSGNLIAGHAAT
jgi:hypothetical protein